MKDREKLSADDKIPPGDVVLYTWDSNMWAALLPWGKSLPTEYRDAHGAVSMDRNTMDKATCTSGKKLTEFELAKLGNELINTGIQTADKDGPNTPIRIIYPKGSPIKQACTP